MSSGYSMGGCPAVSAWPGVHHCGPAVRVGTAAAEAAVASSPTARHSTETAAAFVRDSTLGGQRARRVPEASPAREAAGAEESTSNTHSRGPAACESQRITAPAESAAITQRLRQQRDPSDEPSAGPRQERRARGERLRRDYDRPRLITLPMGPPTARKQETSIQRGQRQ
jgi:hypothetical protein